MSNPMRFPFSSTFGAGRIHSSKPTEVGSLSMKIERQRFESLGCSPEVISTLLKERNPITNPLYVSIWSKSLSYATGRDFNPVSPSASNVLGFLQTGLDLGLYPSSLKV